MRLPQVATAGLFSLTLAPIVGTSLVGFGDSQWSVLVGLVLMLLAAGIFIGMQTARSKRQYTVAEPKVASDKISSNLVALSSAAILAVYSAGYFRTNSAAQLFAEQSVRMRVSASLASGSMSQAAHPADSPFAIPQGRSNVPLAGVDALRAADAAAAKKLSSPGVAVTAKGAAPVAGARRAKSVSTVSDGSTAQVAAGQQQTADVVPAAPALPPSPYKDGTFSGWGSCPHGNIQATVVVASGLIVAADVTRCETRYPCSMIDKLTDEVVYQQKADVDVVTGATESAYAFHIAVTQALSQALK